MLSLILPGVLSGCIAADMAGSIGKEIWAEDAQPPENGSWKSKTNYYEPTVVTSTGEMIRIRYLDVNQNARHEQVKQLIIDHCNGSYNETYRVNESGWTTVEAECIL